MASWPPKKGVAFTFDVGLYSQADATVLQSTPTLAAGDVKFYLDGGAAFNPATLPTATGKRVAVTVSSSEANADRIFIYFSDAAGAEWFDLPITIFTSVRQVDDLAFPLTTGRGILVSSTGAIDSNNTQWLGTSSGMRPSGPLVSTEAPTNWSVSAISATGAYDANVTKVSGASSGAGFIDIAISSRLSSTTPPTNWSNLVVSTSGIVDANVQQWRGAQPSTLAGGSMLKADISLSTGTPTNFTAFSISSNGGVALTTASVAEPTSAPPSSVASIGERITWMSALTLQSIVQVSTLQSLLNSSSGATAVATAVLVPTTSQFTRTRWT